ncbi:RHS repeat domain-containing protein [Pseudomonas sp. NY15435]|uniref:RHS repeat domain-containing protein n=1 Tax=Pseudomonas sp. NY15435 TaxID=3400358 RepID=UPI003A86CEFE
MDNKILISHRITLTLFLTISILPPAFSADYYFWTYNSGSAPRYTSPLPACIDFRAEVHNNNSFYTIAKDDGSYFFSESNYQCRVKLTAPKGQTFSTSRIYLRGGNGCPPDRVYNQTTGECANDNQKGSADLKSCEAEPINVSIGNNYLSETDYSSGKSLPLTFIRRYNSSDGLWRHNFSTHLRFAGSKYASVVMNDGREHFFIIDGATVTSDTPASGTLSKVLNGWNYLSTNNEIFQFDNTGKLTQWTMSTGTAVQLSYSDNQITIISNSGDSLSLIEDQHSQPLTLSTTSAQIIYEYDNKNHLKSRVTSSKGKTSLRQYHYEDTLSSKLLTGITNENGVRYATWSYDDQGRTLSNEHINGTAKMMLAYHLDGSTTVTNEHGKETTYRFQAIQGIKRITDIEGQPSPNCASSNSTFTYDARGLLQTKTDAKGNVTTYDYNARGLETSRTEASGTPQARTITTEWHPTLYLKTKVTEPNRITTYQYDTQGRQTGQIVTPR